MYCTFKTMECLYNTFYKIRCLSVVQDLHNIHHRPAQKQPTVPDI